MYANLPEALKAQIVGYLSSDNFIAAKQIYDQWMQKSSYHSEVCITEGSEG